MILHLVFFKFIELYQWGDEEVVDAELTTRQHPLPIDEIGVGPVGAIYVSAHRRWILWSWGCLKITHTCPII